MGGAMTNLLEGLAARDGAQRAKDRALYYDLLRRCADDQADPGDTPQKVGALLERLDLDGVKLAQHVAAVRAWRAKVQTATTMNGLRRELRESTAVALEALGALRAAEQAEIRASSRAHVAGAMVDRHGRVEAEVLDQVDPELANAWRAACRSGDPGELEAALAALASSLPPLFPADERDAGEDQVDALRRLDRAIAADPTGAEVTS